jgi:predicted amidohydrolase YtcJ
VPKDQDFERLVRARMAGTGERYTTARAALAAQREPDGLAVSDRARSLLGQLADIELAAASRVHLARLPEPERRAAAIEGLRQLAPDVIARTQRYPGQWVVVRDGRVAARGRDSKASRRELNAGGRDYWVAPPGRARPRIP